MNVDCSVSGPGVVGSIVLCLSVTYVCTFSMVLVNAQNIPLVYHLSANIYLKFDFITIYFITIKKHGTKPLSLILVSSISIVIKL